MNGRGHEFGHWFTSSDIRTVLDSGPGVSIPVSIPDRLGSGKSLDPAQPWVEQTQERVERSDKEQSIFTFDVIKIIC